MPQGWDFHKGSVYGSFIADFNRNKVRPALRPFESLTRSLYRACVVWECFWSGLCLPLPLLLSTIPTQVYRENTCTYQGTWLYGSGGVTVTSQLRVISVGDLSRTWSRQDPWVVGPLAYCFGESNVPATALWVGILLSDFCVNSFELLGSTTAGYYQLSFHSHSSILSIQSVSFP